MMGLDNPIHIAFLLILLLLVFGAKRLPEMGRSLGAGMRGFKDSISGEHFDAATPTTPPATAVTAGSPAVASSVAAAVPAAIPAPVAAAEPVAVPVAVPPASQISATVQEPGAPAAA